MNQTPDLAIIKEKIIKTDEVLKILQKKKQENSQLTTNYQILLDRYNNKCKESETTQDSLKLIHKQFSDYCDKYTPLEAQYKKLQEQYSSLESTYNEKMCNLQLKYQETNKELQGSISKCNALSINIVALEQEICELKCGSSPNGKKSKSDKRLDDDEEIAALVKKCTSLESLVQTLKDKNNEDLKHLARLKMEYGEYKKRCSANQKGRDIPKQIKELERSLKIATEELDLLKLSHQHEIAEMNKKHSTTSAASNKEVQKLKDKLATLKLQKQKLEDLFAEEKLEKNMLNQALAAFSDNKIHRIDAQVQTESLSASESDSESLDRFLLEISSVPRLVSPFSRTDEYDSYQGNEEIGFDCVTAQTKIPPGQSFENASTQTEFSLPVITVTPPTPRAKHNSPPNFKTAVEAIKSSSGDFLSVSEESDVLPKKLYKLKGIKKKYKKSFDIKEALNVLKKCKINAVIKNGEIVNEAVLPTNLYYFQCNKCKEFTFIENSSSYPNLVPLRCTCNRPSCSPHYACVQDRKCTSPDLLGFKILSPDLSSAAQVDFIPKTIKKESCDSESSTLTKGGITNILNKFLKFLETECTGNKKCAGLESDSGRSETNRLLRKLIRKRNTSCFTTNLSRKKKSRYKKCSGNTAGKKNIARKAVYSNCSSERSNSWDCNAFVDQATPDSQKIKKRGRKHEGDEFQETDSENTTSIEKISSPNTHKTGDSKMHSRKQSRRVEGYYEDNNVLADQTSPKSAKVEKKSKRYLEEIREADFVGINTEESMFSPIIGKTQAKEINLQEKRISEGAVKDEYANISDECGNGIHGSKRKSKISKFEEVSEDVDDCATVSDETETNTGKEVSQIKTQQARIDENYSTTSANTENDHNVFRKHRKRKKRRRNGNSENEVEHIYDFEQKSIDSGYVKSDSDSSEVISTKASRRKTIGSTDFLDEIKRVEALISVKPKKTRGFAGFTNDDVEELRSPRIKKKKLRNMNLETVHREIRKVVEFLVSTGSKRENIGSLAKSGMDSIVAHEDTKNDNSSKKAKKKKPSSDSEINGINETVKTKFSADVSKLASDKEKFSVKRKRSKKATLLSNGFLNDFASNMESRGISKYASPHIQKAATEERLGKNNCRDEALLPTSAAIADCPSTKLKKESSLSNSEMRRPEKISKEGNVNETEAAISSGLLVEHLPVATKKKNRDASKKKEYGDVGSSKFDQFRPTEIPSSESVRKKVVELPKNVPFTSASISSSPNLNNGGKTSIFDPNYKIANVRRSNGEDEIIPSQQSKDVEHNKSIKLTPLRIDESKSFCLREKAQSKDTKKYGSCKEQWKHIFGSESENDVTSSSDSESVHSKAKSDNALTTPNIATLESSIDTEMSEKPTYDSPSVENCSVYPSCEEQLQQNFNFECEHKVTSVGNEESVDSTCISHKGTQKLTKQIGMGNLLSTPPNVLSLSKKEQLKHIFGIENESEISSCTDSESVDLENETCLNDPGRNSRDIKRNAANSLKSPFSKLIMDNKSQFKNMKLNIYSFNTNCASPAKKRKSTASTDSVRPLVSYEDLELPLGDQVVTFQNTERPFTPKRRQSLNLENVASRKSPRIQARLQEMKEREDYRETVKDVLLKLQPKEIGERASFKRPICSKKLLLSPKSPDRVEDARASALFKPRVIPLERTARLPRKSAKSLLDRLLCYPSDSDVLDETCAGFIDQDPEYIAEIILERVSSDIHDTPDTKHTPPAPIMTVTQRVLLGFMTKLEKLNVKNLLEAFLRQAEEKLLTEKRILYISPVTRLYLAVCKLRYDTDRMRRMVCDAFYFMGDLVVPFLFIVLTCWGDILPFAADAVDLPLVKLLIHVVFSKGCNKPGYNLMNLRQLLNKYYGYELQSCPADQIFVDLVEQFVATKSKAAEYAILILCKNNISKWVFSQIETNLKPVMHKYDDECTISATIALVGKIATQFSTATDACMIKNIEIWLKGLYNDSLPGEIKISIILSLKRITNL